MNIARHLDMTTDHATLLTTIDWTMHTMPNHRFRIDTPDLEFFSRLLFSTIDIEFSFPQSGNSECFDKFALELTEIIRSAYSGPV